MTLTTRDHAMRMLGVRLRAAGLSTPELDARLLVQGVTGASDIEMLREPGTRMSDEEEARLAVFERRRLAGEPVSRILGMREFWGLPFAVTPATLDPRPDSETLVETALALLRETVEPRILDLGTGTGCLLLSLLHERADAQGTGIDISDEALAVAASNAARLDLSARVSFRRGNWTDG
ncbi:MAG: N5-glutamine methyltransferase family protein, partial [Parvibaculum sp.]